MRTWGVQAEARVAADALEGLCDAKDWPLPSYHDMLFTGQRTRRRLLLAAHAPCACLRGWCDAGCGHARSQCTILAPMLRGNGRVSLCSTSPPTLTVDFVQFLCECFCVDRYLFSKLVLCLILQIAIAYGS